MSFGDLAQTFGLEIALLIIAVIAFWRGWVVPGWLYKQMVAENRELRRVAYGGTRAGERSARVAERAVNALAGRKVANDDGLDTDHPE